MKKLFLFLCLMTFNLSAFATELTNPFYLSPKGKLTSVTELSYQKFHVRKLTNGFSDYRMRNRIFTQELSYGISPKVAILGSLSNNWQKQTFDDTGLTKKEDSNIGWSIGALYDLYNKDNMHFQLKMVYLQDEAHHITGKTIGGAYKAFRANVKTGYDLTYILPYLGGEIELPIAQRKEADNNPKFDVYGGIYKSFTDVIAADATLHYNYDKMWKSKKLYGHAELSFFIMPQITLGGFFDYTFFDRGKNNADADGHTIGAIIRAQF